MLTEFFENEFCSYVRQQRDAMSPDNKKTSRKYQTNIKKISIKYQTNIKKISIKYQTNIKKYINI